MDKWKVKTNATHSYVPMPIAYMQQVLLGQEATLKNATVLWKR